MTHQPAACMSPPSPLQDSPASATSTALHEASPSEDLRAIFEQFDENKDGRISKDEMSSSLQRLGLVVPPAELAELISIADTNADGFINYGEFMRLYTTLASAGDDVDGGSMVADADVALREAFEVFDKDGDGLITAKELHSVLKSIGVLQDRGISDCVAMIRRVDSDGNGQVDFQEFKEMMSSGMQ